MSTVSPVSDVQPDDALVYWKMFVVSHGKCSDIKYKTYNIFLFMLGGGNNSENYRCFVAIIKRFCAGDIGIFDH